MRSVCVWLSATHSYKKNLFSLDIDFWSPCLTVNYRCGLIAASMQELRLHQLVRIAGNPALTSS
jgi:hypothetical protein